ncbi:MAG: bifunctional diaminohydroxyphosphoribosylaminopyrimidine deaminase/5-amino-6-(5-phosphoribosylamino)uracil reductase RibD [Coriobacteriia bacterium]|nr:bifunctional diaminohydroxyphosphoribosylaminopyrimidine deaminase/5-amino-6-(5-phosphoribosylamino)uracil reductase RibD [Coriobacteriia bacterium]
MRLLSEDSVYIADPMMRRAYELALLGRGTTSPNPLVGCVIAQDDEIVGEGFHAHAGGPHAEVVALAQAGPRAAGATAYVTLEPCNHWGQTPPCAERLISRAIAGVVIGMPDPNPLAAGGVTRLREAGLEVEFEPDAHIYESLNEEWLFHLHHGRPFVRVKVALSLDGRPTSAPGVRCAISGAGGSRITMNLRSRADAVLVGSATAAFDDPALTVRDESGQTTDRQPLRIILGRDSVPDASMFRDERGPVAALLSSDAAGLPGDVEVIRYDSSGGLNAAFVALGDRGVRSLLVEAGPRLLTALWESDLVDELILLHAGGMVGSGAPAAFLGASDVLESTLGCRMKAVEAGVEGDDAVTVWRRVGSK